MGDQLVSGPLYTRGTAKSMKAKNIYASNGIRTHDLSVWADEDN
jgi:hypothetical protein